MVDCIIIVLCTIRDEVRSNLKYTLCILCMHVNVHVR